MKTKHLKTLQAIFENPVRANIPYRKVILAAEKVGKGVDTWVTEVLERAATLQGA